MKYLVLFVCSMIIPAMNTSAVSIALSNNNVDLIFSIIDFGVFGWGIKRLKEDLIINLLCNIKPITYIIQGVIIILFAVYISYKNRSIKG